MFNQGPKPFVKKANNNSNVKINVADRVLEVVEYVHEEKLILAKSEENKVVAVTMEFDAKDRSRTNGKKNEWSGATIDKNMESVIPAGKKFVAEKLKYIGKKNIGENSYNLYAASWITNTPEDDSKIKQGLVTICGWDGAVKSCQLWRPTSLPIKEGKQSPEVEMVAREMSAVLAAEKEGLHPVRIGYQFRIVKDGEVVEVSHPVDYIPSEYKEGEEKAKSLPISGGQFLDVCKQFYAYFEKGYDVSKDRAEVCIYESFKGSVQGTKMNIVGPLRWYCESQNKLSVDSEGYQVGKNLCCANGVIILTDDKFDRKSKEITPRFIANKVFVNGTVSGNVHSFIRSFGDVKTRFSDILKIKKTFTPQAVSQPVVFDSEDDDENLFGE